MIMTIAIIYICLILCDIWLTVENYFQPLPPEKIHSPLFTHPPPQKKKFKKCKSSPFGQHSKLFRSSLQKRWGDTVVIMDTCIREVAGNYARCRHTKKQKQRQRTCNSMIRMKEITRKSIRKKPKPVKFWTSSPKWKNKNNTFLLKIPNLHQKHHNQFSKRMLNVCWYWQESTYHQERIIIFLD